MEGVDWKKKLQPGARQKVIAQIMDTLKKHIPNSGQETLAKLNQIAVRFEESSFAAANSLSEYLKKLSMQMLSLEIKPWGTGVPNSLPSNSASSSQNQQVTASQTMTSQVHNPWQTQIPLPNPSQEPHQLVSQNNTIVSAAVQGSGSLLPVTSTTQSSKRNAVGQNSNSSSGMTRDAVVNTVGHSVPSYIFPNSRPIGRQHLQQAVSQQQQQQSHNSKQLSYQQQHVQQQPQQQQQNLLQPTQQAQPSLMQSNPPSGLYKNQQSAAAQSTPSVLQQHPQTVPSQQLQTDQSVHEHTPVMHQQKTSIPPQSILPSQQQQLRMEQQLNATLKHNQQFGQQNGIPEMPSASIDSTAQTGNNAVDWQEEVYQKIKSMKEMYLPDLSVLYQKISLKCQQDGSLPQAPNSEHNDRRKMFMQMLDVLIKFLNLSKSNIAPNYKDKLDSYEKKILSLLNLNMPRKPVPLQQQIQMPGGHPLSIEQPQHYQLQQMQSQAPQLQQHEYQMNSQMRPMVVQNSVSSIQSTLCLQQSSVNASQRANVNTMSQIGVNGLQPNVSSLQTNPNMLQQHLMHQKISQEQYPQLQHQFQQQLANRSQKLQQFAPSQVHQMPECHHMSEVGQGMSFKPGTTQQHLSSPQLLQVTRPQLSQCFSLPIDQQSLLTSHNKTGTPLLSANLPFIVPSPSIPLALSPIPGDLERQASGVSSLSNAGNIGQPQDTTGISATSLLAEFTGLDDHQVTAFPMIRSSGTEQPLERLIKAVKSVSPKAFTALSDIESVISMTDLIAESEPGNGSRASVGEDLVDMTKRRMRARNFITQDGSSAIKKMRRDTSAMPLNTISSASSVNDSLKQLIGLESSDLESTATSTMRRPRIEANHLLSEEIREINQRLIDTVVDISDEDVHATAATGGEGTVVKCSFTAIALSPNLKPLYASAKMSETLPLRILVPTNYPNSSPILLDKFPVELSEEHEDLSAKAKSMFSLTLRSLSHPMSLEEMVRTWDFCARAVIADYAQKRGGGTFSSEYGTWESCFGDQNCARKGTRDST